MLVKLQNKLIVAFLFIGLIPMLLSTVIVVSMSARRLERQMESDIRKASEKTMKIIQDYENSAEQIAESYIHNPGFIATLGSAETLQVFQTGYPLILGVPGGIGKTSYGRDIIQLEKPEALVAGVIMPVSDNGEYLGDLVVGYQLGKSFAQHMSLLTAVKVNVGYRRGEPDETASTKIKLMEEAFNRGEGYYDKNASFEDLKYEAYYQPLRTKEGRIVGTIFFGIPKRYGFLTTVARRDFFLTLTGLCIIMAGGLGCAIARHISKPIRLFAKGVHAVADGDLNQEINIRSSQELAELSNAFNRMTGKLRELRQLEEELRRKDRLAALGEMSAGLAHEIRNPLGIIKSSAQVLRKSAAGGEEVKELTSFIVEEVDRLDRVVSNFLDFARPRKLNLEEAKVEDIVERSLHLAEPRLSEGNIKIERDFGDNLPPVKVDSELLSQAFLNLIINAIESMSGGGRFAIKIRSDWSCVDVSFADTGVGLPEENLGKIFNPFFSTKDEGSGLGLAIVHRIVEAHNGTITVESKIDQGSVFTVRLRA